MELSPREAGKLLGLSDESIRRHIDAGRLHAQKHGIQQWNRIKLSDLEDFAQKYHYPLDAALAAQYKES